MRPSAIARSGMPERMLLLPVCLFEMLNMIFDSETLCEWKKTRCFGITEVDISFRWDGGVLWEGRHRRGLYHTVSSIIPRLWKPSYMLASGFAVPSSRVQGCVQRLYFQRLQASCYPSTLLCRSYGYWCVEFLGPVCNGV